MAGLAEMETVPTGFPDLDAALGIAGLPCGRISEIFGPDSSGKQALAAHLVAQCQRAEGVDPAGQGRDRLPAPRPGGREQAGAP